MRFLVLSSLISAASAHFLLLYPESIGFSDDNEGTGPCGGFTPDLSKDKLVDFHVGGDALAMRSTHPSTDWLFRVTTDAKAEDNWEQVWPVVKQSGLGSYCQPNVTVPDKYVGKKGIVSIVANGEDGLLYQCVSVNFVNGTADKQPDKCTNTTSIKVTSTKDGDLSALLGNVTPTSSAASSTDTPDAAGSLQPWTMSGYGFVNAVVVLPMVLAGAMLVL